MSGSVTAWLQGAGRHPLLTPAEELHLGTLIRQWQDHPDGPDGAPERVRRLGLRARERMVCGNLRLVAHVASKASRSLQVPIEDALQAGAIGLQRAAERFDPGRGYKFSTFAYWWIRQGVARESDQQGRTIRLPAQLAPLAGQIQKTTEALAHELKRLPSVDEVAIAVGMRPDDLRDFLARSQRVDSLDRVIMHDGASRSRLGELLAAEQPPDDELLEELRDRLEALDGRTYRLLQLRWFAVPPVTLHAAAAAVNLTPRAAQRIIEAALAYLRSPSATAPAAPPPSADDEAEQLGLPLPGTRAQAPEPEPAAPRGPSDRRGTTRDRPPPRDPGGSSAAPGAVNAPAPAAPTD